MSAIAGFGGSITVNTNGPNGNITEWSATLNVDTIPIPAGFGNSYEGATLGAADITGSFSGSMDTAKPPFATCATNAAWTTVMTANLVLTALNNTSNTNTITVTGAMVRNVRLGRPHNGVATISADFANGTTAPSIAWA